jgi:hypothetical protein
VLGVNKFLHILNYYQIRISDRIPTFHSPDQSLIVMVGRSRFCRFFSMR